MGDRTFDLITKVYNEMTTRFEAIDKRFETMYNEMTTRFEALEKKIDSKADKDDITRLENRIIRLENKLENDTKALFDGYKQTYEKVVAIEKRVDELSAKVEQHDIEIQVIKSGKIF